MHPAGIVKFVAVGTVALMSTATVILSVAGPTTGSVPELAMRGMGLVTAQLAAPKSQSTEQKATGAGRARAPMPTTPKIRPCQAPPVLPPRSPGQPDASQPRHTPGAPVVPRSAPKLSTPSGGSGVPSIRGRFG